MNNNKIGSRALEGIRVLDISNFLAAPMSSMFLADHGADVLKVERPDVGDEIRRWGESKDGVGLYYKVINRGKKSITLDLKSELGVEVVKRLVKDVDVIIENYRTGTLEKWGLGYDVLKEINPGLIMVRITGFGQTGPYRHRPGFGTLAEAYAGYAYISGNADEPPLLPGFALGDASTGVMAAFLTLVALQEKSRTGLGQVVDLAIYETLLTLIGPHVVNYDQLGQIQERNGSRLPFTAPRNTYCTADGRYIAIAGSSQVAFERIALLVERPDLISDRRFIDNRARLDNDKALDAELQAEIGKHALDDLLRRSEEVGATIAPVNDVSMIFEDEQIKARESIVRVEDDQLGEVGMQNVVGKLSRTPGWIERAGPALGEHNREILVEQLGYSDTQLREFGITV
ncbi:putative acyl-CoA transferase/carnitine dehydratase [Pseudomonas sp. GM49]|uniref:CaiB/BaiF CoA transferase family protein n=1 Tax=Pseudomonas sp. GM49 TaxID=1144331 RepID=UPI00027040D7|nr:CaiB/BaiF CoA-transferase family protein [Pseudomonas sp. GM49]EJM57799.1 putative acyl-CoA transferase/carnitine dehydratase [Pseudomonas sp. GM49]